MKNISAIEIQFGAPVNLPDGFEQLLSSALNLVCKQYEKENHDRVMWASEFGSKMLTNPMMMSDGESIEFDDSVFFIGVSEREDLHGRNKNKEVTGGHQD